METKDNIQDNTFKLRFSYYIEAKTTLNFLKFVSSGHVQNWAKYELLIWKLFVIQMSFPT